MEVDLAMLDTMEALTLRGVLERFGMRVNLFPIGRPQHLVDVLSGASAHAAHLILSCHGDERGILVDELAPEVARGEPFIDVLTPGLVPTLASLRGRTVVSSGCCTGSPPMARAFLGADAAAYVAPDGYPSANAALMFLTHLYYGLSERGLSLPDAVAGARVHDEDTRLFVLHAPVSSTALP